MPFFLKAFLFLLILIPFSGYQEDRAQDLELNIITDRLENELNQEFNPDFQTLFHKESATKIKKNYKEFKRKFHNAKWVISNIREESKNNHYIDITINAKQKLGSEIYNLKTKQVVNIKLKEDKIFDYEIISEESILQSSNSPLKVTLNIPDIVLTGTIYNLEVILEEPLDEYVIGGGLVEIKNHHLSMNNMPKMELEAIYSGGLFKKVMAPLEESDQRWGALIAHPNGLIVITKMVRITNK